LNEGSADEAGAAGGTGADEEEGGCGAGVGTAYAELEETTTLGAVVVLASVVVR